MTPRVSVLVLAYNHGPYLAATLDSILKQRVGFSFEILVGEDCSTDDTLEVAERYRAAHPDVVRLVTAPTNVGAHENFIRLVRASVGEYIAICEGDDYWNPCDKLARQVAFLEARPNHGAVHSDFDHIALIDGEWRAKRRYWKASGVLVPQGEVLDELVRSNFIQTCTLMVRGALVREYLESEFASRHYLVGDWPLSLFVAQRSEIGFIPDSLATYRKVEGSATNQGGRADIARAHDHFRMAADFCRWAGLDSSVERGAQEVAMRTVLDRAARGGHVDEVAVALDWLHGTGLESGWRAGLARRILSTKTGLKAFRRRADLLGLPALEGYDARPHPSGECA